MIPVTRVEVPEEAEALVLNVLRSGQLAQGPMVERLEAAFCDVAGTRHAVAVSSGTTALVLAIEALDLHPGDEILTSPFTFAATLNAIIQAGATATFADIDLDDFLIDPAAVEAAITPRTAVVMPVHLYGQPAAMGPISEVAYRHDIAIVEDAAQAHGAVVDGRQAGSFGVGCFSLYATKNVMTGEGGVITTDRDDIADRCRLLRSQGMRRRYEYEAPGYNYRLTDLQAAVGIPQLDRLDAANERRRQNADRLTKGLADVAGIVTPKAHPDRTHVFHQYTIRVTPDAGLTRDELSERLAAKGVGSGIYYPRQVFDYECYREHPLVRVGDFPNARRAAAEVLSLPVHPLLSDSELDQVIGAVRESVGA